MMLRTLPGMVQASLKVLIVDDSREVQASLGRLLGSIHGVCIAGCADDVAGALSLIDATAPDLVVLDVNLLDGDRGMDVLRYVKRHRPATRVIALSNSSSTRLRDSYLEAGSEAYFDKSTEFLGARDWVARAAHAVTDRTGAR